MRQRLAFPAFALAGCALDRPDGRYRGHEAFWEQTEAQYEQTVITAFSESRTR